MNLTESIQNNFGSRIGSFMGSLPTEQSLLLIIFVYTILISLYAIFIFKFYRFLAKKNLLNLDLAQYNISPNPGTKKFLASIFFILEYLIIMPLVVFFWFGCLSIFLLLLSRDQTLGQILLVSAAIVGATRATSYFSEDLSRDLAKMFPFTVLAIFLLSPNFFEFVGVFDKISEIPLFLEHIAIYLIFIVILETFVRFVYLTYRYISGSEETD